MKELSIEQKAKAYDEALKKAKDMLSYKEVRREDMEYLFPELKESKDEKIRKVIYGWIYTQPSQFFDSGFSKEEMLAWLKKQGEQNPVNWFEELEEKLANATPEQIKKWKEKYFNENPADKVEPKFKVGDWVVTSYGKVNQVISVDKDGDGYTLDDGVYFSGSWCDMYHLWTIQDAKPGDVLACESGWTCIFKALDNNTNTFSSYCFMDSDKWFCNTGCTCHTLDEQFIKAYNFKLHPATKEQRDTLMKAMADAEYTFDFEKKELKKIEQKPAWSEEDEEMLNLIIARLHSHPNVELEEYGKAHDWLKLLKNRVQSKQEWSQYLKIEGYENLSDYEKTFDDIADKYVRNKNQKGYNQSWYVKERAAEMLYQANKELKKKESWSEEDEDIRDNVIRDLKRLSGDTVSPNQTYQKEIQWLKSLRPQNRWKPSDEQIEILDMVLSNESMDDNVAGILRELREQLKTL